MLAYRGIAYDTDVKPRIVLDTNVVVVIVLMVRLARGGAPADIQLRGRRLLAMIVAQGAIGYAQYELGIPEWLGILHIAGATAIVGLTVWFHLGLSGPTGRNATSRGTPA